MNLRVAIGQYYPTESKIHKLDPRAKLLALAIFMAMIFNATNFWGYLVAGVGLLDVIIESKVPIRFILRGLRAIIIMMLFVVFMNTLLTTSGDVLFELGFLRITDDGLLAAGRMGTRLVLLIIASSVLTLTTSPIELTDGLEYILKPFKRIGIPAHEIAMMMTIALRFIPTLMEETDRIMKAQISRGADFDTGGIIKKAKAVIPLLVPLFISAFRRADELALAMEARCYRGDENRTRMKKLEFLRADYIFVCVQVVFLILALATRVL